MTPCANLFYFINALFTKFQELLLKRQVNKKEVFQDAGETFKIPGTERIFQCLKKS